MENDEEVKEIVIVEKPDPAVQALQDEFAQYLGFPDVDEKKILANLNRLHQSLRAPEALLDKGNYSRPFPPPPPNPNPKPQQTNSTASAAGAGRRQGD